MNIEEIRVRSKVIAVEVRRVQRSGEWDDAIKASALLASAISHSEIDPDTLDGVERAVERIGHLVRAAMGIVKTPVLEINLFQPIDDSESVQLQLADSNISFQSDPEMFRDYPVVLTLILSKSGKQITLFYVNRSGEYTSLTLPSNCDSILEELINSSFEYTREGLEQSLSTYFKEVEV